MNHVAARRPLDADDQMREHLRLKKTLDEYRQLKALLSLVRKPDPSPLLETITKRGRAGIVVRRKALW